MGRSQFTFYASFARAADRIKCIEDRCVFYDVIKDYALYGIMPDIDRLPDAVAVAFELIQPNLDASEKKASAGKNGGSKSNQTASKPEANASKPEANASKPEANASKPEARGSCKRERERERDREGDRDRERMLKKTLSPGGDNAEKTAAPASGAIAEVQRDYLNRINASASPACLDELAGYVETLGAEVCKRALDVALDEKKPQWSYIRGILRAKEVAGVKCLADWDAQDAKRQTKRGTTATQNGSIPREKQDVSWMAEVIHGRNLEVERGD